MSDNPKVSIVTITYNHEKYIREALESFIAQKTNFNFEIVIADDCSTDNTQKIIKEYAERYPDIIRPILRKKNIGAVPNSLSSLRAAKGEYIALCEGDDFFTNTNKLQAQADFLDKNHKVALCFHRVKVFFEDKSEEEYIFPAFESDNDFTTARLLKENFIQTNSVMYRRQNYDNIPDNILPLDWFLHLYHALYGYIGFIDEVMSAYRRHPGGMWWGSGSDMDNIWKKHGLSYLAGFSELLRIYGGDNTYRELLKQQTNNMLSRLMEVDEKYGGNLLGEALNIYPEIVKSFLADLSGAVRDNEKEIINLRQLVGKAENKNKRLKFKYNKVSQELSRVKKSKSFRTGFYLLHPKDAARRSAQLVNAALTKNVQTAKDHRALQVVQKGYLKESFLNRNIIRANNTKMAVVIHLYYTDTWVDFLKKLKLLNSYSFNLFVTLPKQNEKFANEILAEYPDAYIFIVPNHGRDVLPFMLVAKLIKNTGYEYLLKLHSKKSKHRTDGHDWFIDMLNSLIPENKYVLDELIKTISDRGAAVVGPEGHYVSLKVNYAPNKAGLNHVLYTMYPRKVRERLAKNHAEYGFFAGTMFWMRLDALEPILARGFDINDFAPEKGQIDATLAHALERAYSIVPELEKKQMYEIGQDGIKQINYKTDNIPEWSNVYRGD